MAQTNHAQLKPSETTVNGTLIHPHTDRVESSSPAQLLLLLYRINYSETNSIDSNYSCTFELSVPTANSVTQYLPQPAPSVLLASNSVDSHCTSLVHKRVTTSQCCLWHHSPLKEKQHACGESTDNLREEEAHLRQNQTLPALKYGIIQLYVNATDGMNTAWYECN